MGKLAESNHEGIFLHDQMKRAAACQEENHLKQSKIDWKQWVFKPKCESCKIGGAGI